LFLPHAFNSFNLQIALAWSPACFANFAEAMAEAVARPTQCPAEHAHQDQAANSSMAGKSRAGHELKKGEPSCAKPRRDSGDGEII